MRRFFYFVLETLGRLRPAVIVAIAALLVALIFLASHAIPVDIRFPFLYLVPVALTAWFAGPRTAALFSVLGAAASSLESLAENGFGQPGSLVIYTNGVLLLGFSLLFSSVLSALRAALWREKASGRVDPLTQISNRRAFSELAGAEIQRMARYGGSFTVAYLDLDDFKLVNDRFGHEAGDRVLVATAHAIRTSLRVNDIVARLGGDEFVVLLPETEPRDAEAVLRKLEAQLATVMRDGRWAVTVSIGAATFEKPPVSVEQMVELVDVLMYSAKSKGKGRLERRVIGASGSSEVTPAGTQ
jgi:diguanylate cyclase (GGDEF)-like protein